MNESLLVRRLPHGVQERQRVCAGAQPGSREVVILQIWLRTRHLLYSGKMAKKAAAVNKAKGTAKASKVGAVAKSKTKVTARTLGLLTGTSGWHQAVPTVHALVMAECPLRRCGW